MVYSRYRYIESSADVVTSNDVQYKEAFRARFNADAKKRYTLHVGFFSGSSFTSTWNYTGLGINDADYHNYHVKQLFVAAAPVAGLELQAGGLYIIRGESTDQTSYDEDGYLVGERVSLRRPKQLYLDELSVTRAALGGPDAQGRWGTSSTPSLFDRWDGLGHQQYTQLLAAKRFTPIVATSVDYTRASGVDTVRAAVSLRFKPHALLSSVRGELYRRVNGVTAGGFAVTVEKTAAKGLRLQGGYATIDERYGNLNADRTQRGKRLFATANIVIRGALSASLFATRAFDSPFAVSNRTRFDAVIQYDVLAALRSTGKF
ncbi:MAG: hypothetical protein ABI972_19995 [Acidobacteriota bacterium]